MSLLGNPGKLNHAKYCVETHFVLAVFDLECDSSETSPVYRIYVNDELFTERKWQWSDEYYLEQVLQIQAPSGTYAVRVESKQAKFTTRNHRIDHGPARWEEQEILIQS